MQVNKISFGRIIPISSDSDNKKSDKRIDSSTYEICKILNSEHTSKYSKKQAASIREFFKSVLGDYNGQDGIIFKQSADGDIVLLSGKDAKEIKKLENKPHFGQTEYGKRTIANMLSKKLKDMKNNSKQYILYFRTGKETAKGFNIFNQISYGKLHVTYGKKTDGVIKETTSSDSNTIYKVSLEEKSLNL